MIVAIEIGVFYVGPSDMVPAYLYNLRVINFVEGRVGRVMRSLEGIIALRIVAANQCPAGIIRPVGGRAMQQVGVKE